jgi:hypothetical protein
MFSQFRSRQDDFSGQNRTARSKKDRSFWGRRDRPFLLAKKFFTAMRNACSSGGLTGARACTENLHENRVGRSLKSQPAIKEACEIGGCLTCAKQPFTFESARKIKRQRIKSASCAQSRAAWDAKSSTSNHGVSGAKGRDTRPQFDRLCRDATKRQFDMVMAWSVDRLGRSLQDLCRKGDPSGLFVYAL